MILFYRSRGLVVRLPDEYRTWKSGSECGFWFRKDKQKIGIRKFEWSYDHLLLFFDFNGLFEENKSMAVFREEFWIQTLSFHSDSRMQIFFLSNPRYSDKIINPNSVFLKLTTLVKSQSGQSVLTYRMTTASTNGVAEPNMKTMMNMNGLRRI